MRRGVFPGSFDPLTVAHLAIADAAVHRLGLTALDLTLSNRPLAKEHRVQVPVDDRITSIERHRSTRPWLRARRTSSRLLADIAAGYDVLVVGADKWHQLHDPAFYESDLAMREALARLPMVALARRAGADAPSASTTLEVVILDVDPSHALVSSSAVRSGRDDWRA